MNKYFMCPRINLSSFSRCELGTPLLKLLNCKRNNDLKKPHPSTPELWLRLYVNAFYFSTTARRVTSPTWGPLPSCKQAVIKTSLNLVRIVFHLCKLHLANFAVNCRRHYSIRFNVWYVNTFMNHFSNRLCQHHRTSMRSDSIARKLYIFYFQT